MKMSFNVDDFAEFEELPEFANEENRALHTHVKDMEKQLQVVSSEYNECTDRQKILLEHLKNVKQEHGHTQQLVDHKEKEIETEIHLRQLAEREIGRLRAEMAKFDRVAADLQDSVNSVQNKIFRGNEGMDQFKVQLNWNQEELEQWVLASKQKEEDNVALERYAKADHMKINDKALQVERLTVVCNEKKLGLDKEVTETQAAQIELDKTAEQFRALHEERQHLIKQWEDALSAMKRRDEAITEASYKFADLKKQVEMKEKELTQKSKFLENEKVNNREKEVAIQGAERQIQRLHLELKNEERDLAVFSDEVDVVSNTLIKCATELSLKRTMLINVESGLDEKKKRLGLTHREHKKVLARLAEEKDTAYTLEEKAKMEEAYRVAQEARITAIDKELKEVKEATFKQSQELFNLRKEEADMIADISGAQNRDRMMKGRVAALDRESQKQNQLLYNVDFQLQQLERKVARAGGERSLEEKGQLEKKIKILQDQLEEQVKEQKLLNGQVKTIEVTLKLSTIKRDQLLVEYRELTDRVNEIRLENSSSRTTLKSKTKMTQSVMVQHDVLKLELTQLRKKLREVADEVVALENRQCQLKLSMESKEKEIALHKEVLRMEHRTTEEQRHEFLTTLNEKKMMVEKLEARLKAVQSTMSSSDSGEKKSQTYFLIKAAQEREQLQRDGDLLDAKLKQTEKEILSLNMLLRTLNVKNQAYKQSFAKADPNGQDAGTKKSLESKHRQVEGQLKRKEQALHNLEEDVAVVDQRLQVALEEDKQLSNFVGDLKEQHDRIDSEFKEQQERLEKGLENARKAKQDLRVARGLDMNQVTPEELDLELQEAQKINQDLLAGLASVLKIAGEHKATIANVLKENGLKLS